MIIKRYLVDNMNEAMSRIRTDLGKDAVIISQKRIRKPGFKGLFSKKVLEVTACAETAKKGDNDNEAVKSSIEAIKKAISSTKEEEKPAAKQPVKAEVKEVKQEKKVVKKENTEMLMEEMQEMKNMLNSLAEKKTKAKSKTKIQSKLESIDVNEKIAKKIVTKVNNSKNADLGEDEKLKKALTKCISVSKTNMTGRVVLIGPTGVGKTTTIAKLAGRLSLVEKKKVGLITIDTYRIGAVDQLRTYAEIMNLPFKVVISIKEMEAAIESMKDLDTILIDTTGRSSKNSMQISELRAFVEKAKPDLVNLVLSCTTKNSDIETIINGYKELNFDELIVTKLDETTTYGSLLNIMDLAKKPISYVTVGQNVPDDIKKPTTIELSNLILGEDSIC